MYGWRFNWLLLEKIRGNKMKSGNITLGGILIALTIIILYSASILPVSTISVLTIASAIVPVCIIRSDVNTAVMVYLASSIISIFFIPLNIWLLYTLIFGGYGIVKYFIERLRKEKVEILLKFIYYNVIFILAVILAKAILGIDVLLAAEKIISKYIAVNGRLLSGVLYWAIGAVVYYLYDYAMTLIITFYMERIHNKIK